MIKSLIERSSQKIEKDNSTVKGGFYSIEKTVNSSV